MILGEREHELPIVVVHCIEELYRTGLSYSLIGAQVLILCRNLSTKPISNTAKPLTLAGAHLNI
jgi:hypothetical protein